MGRKRTQKLEDEFDLQEVENVVFKTKIDAGNVIIQCPHCEARDLHLLEGVVTYCSDCRSGFTLRVEIVVCEVSR